MSPDTTECKKTPIPANGKTSPLVEIEAHHQGRTQRLPVKYQGDNAINEQDELKQGKQLFDRAVEKLLSSENVIVLLGSGASLALNKDNAKVAPSMADLWNECEKSQDKFDEIKTTVGYNDKKKDIEALLSRCKGFVEYAADKAKSAPIEVFIKAAEKTIFEQTNFADKPELSGDIESLHGILLERLGRRSPRLGRLKVFTTNYDRCVGVAAEQKGFVIIDGFSFSSRPSYSPGWFDYDIIRRSAGPEERETRLQNVAHLYKLHGSVDWLEEGDGRVVRRPLKDSETPLLIYPRNDKYQASYQSPFIDMISAWMQALRQPKTTLLCIGFGFNDDHLVAPVFSALARQGDFNLIVASRSLFDSASFNEKYRKTLRDLMSSGDERVALMSAGFADLAPLFPQTRAESPQEKLARLIYKNGVASAQGGE